MANGDQPQLHVNCHVVVDIPEVSDDMLFRDFTPPSMDLVTHEAKSWVENGLPVNSLGGGKKIQWGTVSFGRGVDPANKAYGWMMQAKEQGATAVKKEVTATVMAEDGSTTLQTWTFHGAICKNLTWGALGAESGDIFAETMVLSFDDAEMTPGG